MDVKRVLQLTDHTLLRVGCTEKEVAQACEDAVACHCAAVCVPPCFNSFAKECIAGRGVKVCAAVGFPNGYNTTQIKVAETEDAIANGADEIDMVINMSFVKDGEWDKVREEIDLIRKASEGHILKVIVETCLLTEEEKIKLCRIVTECGADFIKTSTGFSSGGATVADVVLFRKHIGPEVQIKAAGGIHTVEEAQAMIDAGASRIGTSSIVKAAKEIK